MKESVEGIIVLETPYGETSKIIQILTKEYGMIGCMAKGAKSLKSNLRTVSTKLTYGIFHIHYKKDRLSLLASVDILDYFKNIKKDITKISYASYIVELATQVYKQNQNVEIYDLLMMTLKKIEDGFEPLVLMNILELKYLEYLGVLPILDSCSICGSKNSIATLSSNRGGYICNSCLTNEKVVSEKTIKLIRMFYYVDISKISNLEISDASKNEINDFLDGYYEKYTGLYLKSKIFIQNLSKVG